MKTYFEYIACGLFFVLIFITAVILEGFVFFSLWEWFVVPLGIKAISLLHAIGICILFDFATSNYIDYKKTKEAGLVTSLSYILVRPAITFVVGGIVKLIMVFL